MGVYQTVSTGSSYGIIINVISNTNGNAYAISASAGSIVATSFTGGISTPQNFISKPLSIAYSVALG